MAEVETMYCSLCIKPHKRKRLEQDWYARVFRRCAHYDSAKRLICPECLERIMHGSVTGKPLEQGKRP